MIEKVLEAYEARIVGRKTFAQKLSKMDKITKAVFWGVIISAIVLFICGFIIPKPALLVVMSVYGAGYMTREDKIWTELVFKTRLGRCQKRNPDYLPWSQMPK